MKTLASIKRSKYLRVMLLVFIVLLAGALVWLSILATRVPDWPDWTGLDHKSAWDLADLLIIPVVLTFGALWLNHRREKLTRKIEAQRLQEETMQKYFDRVMGTLFDKGSRLPVSGSNDPLCQATKVQTLTVLRRLNAEQKGIVVRFLYDLELITSTANIGQNINLLRDAQGEDRRRTMLPAPEGPLLNLYGANLVEANLRLALLSNISLGGTDMSRVDLSGATLSNANLSGTGLVKAVLTDVTMPGANLNNTILDEANLSGENTYLIKTTFVGAKLRKATLSEANLSGCDLTDADLTEATLIKTLLRGANLSRAILKRTNLTEANLRDAQLPSADLHEAILKLANLNGVNLNDAALRQADLSNATLSMGISEATLCKADLTEAKLYKSYFGRSDMSEAILIKADLREANLRQVTLIGAHLRGANLRGADLSEANLSGADLSETKLQGANLSHTILYGANLRGAKYDRQTRWPEEFLAEEVTRPAV